MGRQSTFGVRVHLPDLKPQWRLGGTAACRYRQYHRPQLDADDRQPDGQKVAGQAQFMAEAGQQMVADQAIGPAAKRAPTRQTPSAMVAASRPP